jgi:hypothetical protein
VQTKDQTEAGLHFFAGMLDKMARGESSKIGIPLLIGHTAKEKFENLTRNLKDNLIELQSGIYLRG